MRLLRAQARRVVDEDFDVLVAEALCSGGHVAVEVGAFLRLEFAQLREKILVLLSRQTRDVLLAAQRWPVALHAVELLRELRPRRRALGRGLVPGSPRPRVGGIGGQL